MLWENVGRACANQQYSVLQKLDDCNVSTKEQQALFFGVNSISLSFKVIAHVTITNVISPSHSHTTAQILKFTKHAIVFGSIALEGS